MPKGTSAFRQSDVTRAVKAVKAAGEPVARVEIDQEGKIVVITRVGTALVSDESDITTEDREVVLW
jgi:hypothetical protein